MMDIACKFRYKLLHPPVRPAHGDNAVEIPQQATCAHIHIHYNVNYIIDILNLFRREFTAGAVEIPTLYILH